MRATNRILLNTSIKLRKNNAALNTSRRILQKSINRSVMCATSLKSNNAALAKKVAELQLELNAQRTAAREAAIESCKLQMQVARLQPLVEARIRLKDNMLQLRELMATMLDTDLAVMRCVNEMASVIEGPNASADQSVCGTTNWWADTVLEITNLLNPDRTFRDTSQIRPSPILPPPRRRRAIIPCNQEPTPASDLQSDQFPCVTTAPLTTQPSISPCPPPPPAVVDFPHSVKKSPALVQLQSQSASEFVPPSPPPIQLSPRISLHNLVTPLSKPVPPTVAPVEPEFTVNCSPVELPDPQPSPQAPSSLATTDSLQSHENTDVEANPQPSPIVPRVSDSPGAQCGRPKRQARLKAKPIIDLSTSNAMDSPKWETDQYSRKKRRRRLVLREDDDDYEGDHASKPVSTRPQRPGRTKKTAQTTTKHRDAQVYQTEGNPAPEPQGRVVEVKITKPGRMAFQANAKHAPSTTARTEPFQSTGGTESVKPKSVFDLTTDQTINMSVLPATLDELRQREQAKKQQSTKDGESRSDSQPQITANQEIASRCTENQGPSVQCENRLSVLLSPMRSVPKDAVVYEKPHPVLTEHNQQPSKRHFRRLLLDHDSDDDTNASENRPGSSVPSTTTQFAAGSGRAKRAHKT